MAAAQSLLEKKISLEAAEMPLGRLLSEAERQGGFHFSYNSEVLPEDSLVTLSLRDKTVKEMLDTLLRRPLEYHEAGNYIIIRLRGRSLALTLEDIKERKNSYQVSGFVTDLSTGRPLANASVYERQLLLAALTDDKGHFRLRIRDDTRTVALTASKALYEDTTMFVQLKGIVVLPYNEQDRNQGNRFSGEGASGAVEKTGLGRYLTSSRQRIQSLNLREFFAESPVQASLTPGLSSQGSMSAQIINKFSLNVIGGYTAGVEGMEMAGVFNINKKSVEYVQLGGAFNIVGGSVKGFQAAGMHNMVLGSVNGLQLGGGYNRVKGDVSGMQAAGGANFVSGSVNGVQVSGGLNITLGAFDGVQVSGGVNYVRELKGVQIGIVNIADSSSGYSIGLLNIIRKNGFLRFSLSTNESFRANLAFKSGTSKLYAILQGGITPGPGKLYAYGAGFGKEIPLRRGFSIQPELLFQEVYQGSSAYNNQLYRFNLRLHYQLAKTLHLFAGPAFNIWNSNQESPVDGYGFIPAARGGSFSIKKGSLKGWIGWSAGISIL